MAVEGIKVPAGFTIETASFADTDFNWDSLALANTIPPVRRYDGKPIYINETTPAETGLYFLQTDLITWKKYGATAKANLTAIIPPVVGDDSSQGYAIGSLWLDTVANEYYRCSDATVGAAVWPKTTLTADELATVAISGQYVDLLGLPDLSSLPSLSQTLNFIELETFYFTQGQDYNISSVIEQSGLNVTIKLGGTATNYVLGSTVDAFDVLDITVDIIGAVTLKGTLL